MTKYTVECDESITVLARQDYSHLDHLAQNAQTLYWRGFVTGGIIFTVGWVTLAVLVMAGR